MNKYHIIFISLLILLNNNTFADSLNVESMKNVNEFLTQVEKESKNTLSISSDFTQEKHLSFISEKVISKGKFYFKKENLLRWEYIEPYEYLIVINGDRFYIRDNDRVISFDIKSSKMFTEINDIMLSALTGDIFKDKTKFTPAFFETRSEYIIKLLPASGNMKKFLTKIVLFFSKVDYSLIKLQMIEKNADKTDITFSNKIMNNEIPDEKFNID